MCDGNTGEKDSMMLENQQAIGVATQSMMGWASG